jgi:hypothetical protein
MFGTKCRIKEGEGGDFYAEPLGDEAIFLRSMENPL